MCGFAADLNKATESIKPTGLDEAACLPKALQSANGLLLERRAKRAHETIDGAVHAAGAGAREVVETATGLAARLRFVIAGSGPLLGHLRTLSGLLGLSDRVEFVGDVEESKMLAFLRSLDIIINPCICESILGDIMLMGVGWGARG